MSSDVAISMTWIQWKSIDSTDLFGHRPTCPVGHPQTRCGDRRVFTGPRADPARHARTTPPVLAPAQPGAPTEHSEVNEFDCRAVLDGDGTTAARARRARFACLDMHKQRLIGGVYNDEHVHIGESDQQLAHARRVHFHRGSPELDCLRQRQVRRAPVPRQGCPTPRSFPKRRDTDPPTAGRRRSSTDPGRSIASCDRPIQRRRST